MARTGKPLSKEQMATLKLMLVMVTIMLLWNAHASKHLGPAATVTETLVAVFSNGKWWGKVLFIGFFGWFCHITMAMIRSGR